MKRLALAVAVLLAANLLTLVFRWLSSTAFLPAWTLWAIALIAIGITILGYFSVATDPTNLLERYALKIYGASALAGVLLGLV